MEKRESVDQTSHRALALIAAAPQRFARQGAVAASWRYHTGQKLGPYFQLRYREDGRQRSLYLGREGPLVQQVRQALARLQTPLRRCRAYARDRHQMTAALRRQKADTNRHLSVYGIRFKGWEVRGWRTSVFARYRRALQIRGIPPVRLRRISPLRPLRPIAPLRL